MSPKQLIKIKGEPKEINNNIGDTPFDEYVFEEKIYGFQGKGSYQFYKSNLGPKLQSASIICENLYYSDAKNLIDKILNSFENSYSKQKDFYKEDLKSDNKSYLQISLGVNHKATGISCDMTYENNSLKTNIIKQN